MILKEIEFFMHKKSENPVVMEQTKQVFLKTCLLEDSDVRRAEFMSELASRGNEIYFLDDEWYLCSWLLNQYIKVLD